MQLINKILNFYINSSIHVALSVISFMKITDVYFGINSNSNLIFFIFFGTITGYNFIKYAGVAKLHHKSLTESLKIIQIFSLLSFLILIYFGFKLSIKLLIFILPFCLLTFFYAVPIFKGLNKNLRQIGYLKIIVIALVWSAVTVLIPFYNSELSFSYIEVIYFIQRFLIVLVLTLPFDIRDLAYDAVSLHTIPQKIGVNKTKRLGVILMVIALVLEYALQTQDYLKSVFMLVFFMILIFLMRSNSNQSKYYSSFWVEAIPIFWVLLIVIFNIS